MAISFYYMTETQYKGITPIEDALYFITDNRRIYKGTNLYSESFESVATLPTSPRLGCLYFNSTDKTTQYYNGSAWVTVIPTLVTSIGGTGSDSAIPTEKAVRDAITTAMSGVGGDILESALWLSSESEGYSSGDRTLVDIAGMQDGDMCLVEENGTLYQYDAESTETESGSSIVAPASGVGRWKKMLVATTYTAGNGITIDGGEISVNADSSEFTFSSGALTLGEVPATKVSVSKTGTTTTYLSESLTKLMPKASVTTAGNVAIIDSSGNAVDSGKAIGGETLASSPDASTIATELAVSSAISSALEWKTV